MPRLGMDDQIVEAAGTQLKQRAGQLGTLINDIEKIISGLNGQWDGPDAKRFINEWWPQHKKALASAQHNIDGLGQAALNNVTEQRNASGR